MDPSARIRWQLSKSHSNCTEQGCYPAVWNLNGSGPPRRGECSSVLVPRRVFWGEKRVRAQRACGGKGLGRSNPYFSHFGRNWMFETSDPKSGKDVWHWSPMFPFCHPISKTEGTKEGKRLAIIHEDSGLTPVVFGWLCWARMPDPKKDMLDS